MDIFNWSKGAKVAFINCNGYDDELKIASETFNTKDVYTVKDMRIYAFSSYVEVEEHPGIWANTVMFEDIEEKPTESKPYTHYFNGIVVGTSPQDIHDTLRAYCDQLQELINRGFRYPLIHLGSKHEYSLNTISNRPVANAQEITERLAEAINRVQHD